MFYTRVDQITCRLSTGMCYSQLIQIYHPFFLLLIKQNVLGKKHIFESKHIIVFYIIIILQFKSLHKKQIVQ